jgi:hypothetical protein
MIEKINEGRRNFMKAAGLTGAALTVGLHERFADARPVGPGVIKRDEIPSWYKPGEIRNFVRLLDKKGELIKIKKEVDPKYEIGGFLWQYEQQGRAVLFENVKGSNIPVIGTNSSSRSQVRALEGCHPDR